MINYAPCQRFGYGASAERHRKAAARLRWIWWMKWTTIPAFPKQMSAMNYPESSHALTRKPITSGENLTLGTCARVRFGWIRDIRWLVDYLVDAGVHEA
jgi:hypothetical protein